MNDEAQKPVRRARRLPTIAATHIASDTVAKAERTIPAETPAAPDIIHAESYPGEEGYIILQDQETAARSRELILKENRGSVKDTFISAKADPPRAVPEIDILIPTESDIKERKESHTRVQNTVFPAPHREHSEAELNMAEEEYEAEESVRIPLTKKFKIALGITAAALLISLLSIGYAFFQNDTVGAYEVSVGGKHLGYVDDKHAVVESYNALLKENENVDAMDLSFAAAAVPASAVLTNEEQTALLYTVATEGYVRGYTVTVGGEAVAYILGEEEIRHALDTLYSIRLEGIEPQWIANGTLKYTNDIKWEYGYVKESDVSDASTLISVLGAKDILTYVIERTVTTPEVLRYETEFRDNDENFDGITTMISHGKNGIAQAEYLETVDPDTGVVLSSEHKKTTVIEAPVNAVSYYGEYPLLDESVCTDSFIFPFKEPEDNTWIIGTQVMSMPMIYLSSGYGARTLWGAYDFHLGYDIAAPRKTEILACDGGIAVDVGYSDSYGYFVRLQHRNGVETMYAHMSERLVKEGEYVKQGQVIGLVGATGNTSGNHLHLEFRRDHVTCDPAEYLSLPDWVLLEKDKEKYNGNEKEE